MSEEDLGKKATDIHNTYTSVIQIVTKQGMKYEVPEPGLHNLKTYLDNIEGIAQESDWIPIGPTKVISYENIAEVSMVYFRRMLCPKFGCGNFVSRPVSGGYILCLKCNFSTTVGAEEIRNGLE